VNDGEMYGETNRAFIRVNIACPRKTLADGLLRMEKGLLAKFG